MTRTITILLAADQAAQVEALRAREAAQDDERFWRIVIGDGLDLYRFQLDLDEAGEAEAQRRAYENALPERPGPTNTISVPVEDDQAAALDELRARRPDWDDARFWREAVAWGIRLLRQRIDQEDRPTFAAPESRRDDEIPF